MRKYYFVIFVLALCSCNEMRDPFEKDNKAPVISLKSPYFSEFTNDKVFIDSVKLGKSYQLDYLIQDEDNKLPLSFLQSNTWKIEKGESYVKVTPSEVGETTLLMTTTDCYRRTSEVEVKLACFINLPPVAHAQCDVIAIINPLERKINATTSYDRDQKYGGKILAYEFTIGGTKTVTNNVGYMMHIFPKAGTYRVKVRVKDSDGIWSEEYFFDANIE